MPPSSGCASTTSFILYNKLNKMFKVNAIDYIGLQMICKAHIEAHFRNAFSFLAVVFARDNVVQI